MQTLKNEFLQVLSFGDPEKVVELEHQDLDINDLDDNAMVVEMIYAGIHPADILSIEGHYGNAKFNTEHWTPSGLGLEGVGKVIFAGKKAKFKKDQIIVPFFGTGEVGSWSKYVVVKDGMDLPKDLDMKMAAHLFVNPFSIVGMFAELEKVGSCENKWLVITAANSTLSRMAIRYGKERKAKIIGIVRKSEIVQNVEEEGCDFVLCTTKDNIDKRIMDVTEGKGADLALDAVGGELANHVINSMAIKGQVICYGLLSGLKMSLNMQKVLFRQVYIQGFNLLVWLTENQDLTKIKQTVINEMESKTFDSKVEAVYDIHDYKKALHHQAHSDHARTGKLLFSF